MSDKTSNMSIPFARAFDEWIKRYQVDPEQFAKDFGDVGTYGERAGRYFETLLNDLADGQPWQAIQ